jgi:CubicO group peptidase (beta-lactamase class C family)
MMMKLHSAVPLFLIAMFFLPPAKGQNTEQDRSIRELLIRQKFNGSVLVARKGKILIQEQTGFADMAFGIPVSEHTKFEIASITKPFTALLVLRLAQEGKIQLDEKLTKYLPEVTRPEAQAITVHHMLSHTSGIQDYVGISPEFASWTDQKILEELGKTPISFAPGTQFQYSSSTYILLRMVIERATGKTYEENLTQYILGPAGMTETGVTHNQQVVAEKAPGYVRSTNGFKQAFPVLNTDLFLGAASLYTTANDLLKWDQALYSGKLLNDKYQQLMYTIVLGPYGYGWFIEQTQGGKIVSHGGDTFGYTSLILRELETQTVFIILSNVQSMDRAAILDILKKAI